MSGFLLSETDYWMSYTVTRITYLCYGSHLYCKFLLWFCIESSWYLHVILSLLIEQRVLTNITVLQHLS